MEGLGVSNPLPRYESAYRIFPTVKHRLAPTLRKVEEANRAWTQPRDAIAQINTMKIRDQVRDVLVQGLRRRGFHVNVVGDSVFAFCELGKFELTIMPGNWRVLISQKSEVFPRHRGKGFGTKFLCAREELALEAGCNLLLATVREDNVAEIHLLETHGWKRFNKRDTGVSLWGKEL